MPLREIPYRLNQAALKKFDKIFLPNSSPSEFTSDFSCVKISKFPSGEHVANHVQLSDREIFADEAEKIIRHRLNIFGVEADFGNQIDFHLDPKTGKSWPLKFWGDIDYRDGKTVGGIKFAWELNRLQHWPRLAMACRLTGNRKYCQEVLSELDRWIKENPYPKGINWISGIELGLRMVSLFYSLKFIGTESLKAEDKLNILNFVQLHGRHLFRYPSKYSSCANHALAEALGLFIAGLAFPGLENASKWKAFGKEVLEREVTRQILPDGTSFEYTVPYLQFVADHFLIYYLLCKEYGEKISPKIEQRLMTICEFMVHIVDENCNIPMIGDDDSGYLLKLSPGDSNNFLSILNTCGILFQRSDWLHPASLLDVKTLFLLGVSARRKWENLYAERTWKRKSAYFSNAGLAVIAHDKSGQEVLFVGNSGPTGLKPLGGHGHADALSFWLSVGGQPFFIDPGTYLYHSGGRWRRYFRSTAAHNTIEIDGQDQAEQLADFMFADFYHIHDVVWSEETDAIVWGAAHDGYRRLPDPVMHNREVTFYKRQCLFKIVDSITAQKEHEIKLFFHLHPDVHVEGKGENTFLMSFDATTIMLSVDSTMKATLYCGSKNPLSGWYSPKFNRLRETTTLVFSKEICGNAIIESTVTIL